PEVAVGGRPPTRRRDDRAQDVGAVVDDVVVVLGAAPSPAALTPRRVHLDARVGHAALASARRCTATLSASMQRAQLANPGTTGAPHARRHIPAPASRS